jgi:predicted ester cyclase
MGTPADNKELVQRFMTALNTGDVAGAAACFDAERYYSHAHGADLAGTWEQMKAWYRSGTFADASAEQIAFFGEGDRVVNHARVTAVHNGTYLGVPASGRTVTFDSMEIWRIEGDKIVEHWGGLHEATRLFLQMTGQEQPGD